MTMLRRELYSVWICESSTVQKRWNWSTRSYHSTAGIMAASGWLPTTCAGRVGAKQSMGGGGACFTHTQARHARGQ